MNEFTVKTEMVCKCGAKMETAPGSRISGLVVVSKGFWRGQDNHPVSYCGQNTPWVCPKCGKRVEIYVGFEEGEKE